MTKITIPGFIHAQPADDWDDSPAVVAGHRMAFFTSDDMESCGYVLVGPAVVSFDMPDDFDPRAKQIDALRRKASEVRAAFQKRITEIEAQINKLQALEMAA